MGNTHPAPDTAFHSSAARRAWLLPDWPRAMDVELAAAYCSISPATLRREGPAPVTIGRERKVWLRDQLDAWLDRLAGIVTASEEKNPWDDV